jgi:hypothetical protein
MSTTSNDKSAVKSMFEVDESSMRTNQVDQVSSLLMSLVLMVGLAVLVLGLLFFLNSLTGRAKIFQLEPERIAGRGDHAAGFERDFDPPGAEEVEQLTEPAMEQTLQMVTDVISSVTASLDSLESTMAANSQGTGKGDSRPPGPEGEGDDIVPRFDRWELKFTARDKRNYASQLDFFNIELAAIGGGKTTVDYASSLATSPTKRSGPGDKEKRLYFMYRTEGPLLQYDRALLQAAGVLHNGRVVLKFIPAGTEETLAQAEAAYYLEKRSKEFRVTDIGKTTFECRPNSKGKGYEWVVIDQRYRNKNPTLKK